MAIYARHHNHRGIAGVHINRGFLRLDAGDLESAAAEGAEAFRHGEEKHDYIIMARARTLECIIENAAVEEQVGDPAAHHEAAEAFARDAVAVRRRDRKPAAAGPRPYLAGPDFRGRAGCRPGSGPPLPGTGHRAAAAGGDRAPVRLGRAGTIEGRRAPRQAGGRHPAGVVRGRGGGPDLPADDRGICPHRHPQSVGTRGTQGVARGGKLSISPKKVRRILHAAGVLRSDHGARGCEVPCPTK